MSKKSPLTPRVLRSCYPNQKSATACLDKRKQKLKPEGGRPEELQPRHVIDPRALAFPTVRLRRPEQSHPSSLSHSHTLDTHVSEAPGEKKKIKKERKRAHLPSLRPLHFLSILIQIHRPPLLGRKIPHPSLSSRPPPCLLRHGHRGSRQVGSRQVAPAPAISRGTRQDSSPAFSRGVSLSISWVDGD